MTIIENGKSVTEMQAFKDFAENKGVLELLVLLVLASNKRLTRDKDGNIFNELIYIRKPTLDLTIVWGLRPSISPLSIDAPGLQTTSSLATELKRLNNLINKPLLLKE